MILGALLSSFLCESVFLRFCRASLCQLESTKARATDLFASIIVTLSSCSHDIGCVVVEFFVRVCVSLFFLCESVARACAS